jgi:hypothetical protein
MDAGTLAVVLTIFWTVVATLIIYTVVTTRNIKKRLDKLESQ